MKFQRFSILLATLVGSSLMTSIALAQADLAKTKNCMACHATETKLVGPAFKDVAAKYKQKKGVQDELVRKVMKGGSGVWGGVPMPANPQVNDAEARQLVDWVLSLK
jgi:cytochrome c